MGLILPGPRPPTIARVLGPDGRTLARTYRLHGPGTLMRLDPDGQPIGKPIEVKSATMVSGPEPGDDVPCVPADWPPRKQTTITMTFVEPLVARVWSRR